MSNCVNDYRSKRTYPESDCANLKCEHGKKFIPHDRRQKFCCPLCKSSNGNDRRRELILTKYSQEKQLRLIDLKLGKLYFQYLIRDACLVHKDIFNHEQIDLRFSVEQSTNIYTNEQVKWYYEFGVELHYNDNNFFIIHKRII